MAINAKFQADFSDFQTAVSKAEVSLKSFETGAGKVGTSLNKMANSLSGNAIIQQATVMAEAVDRVGGVSKLTESELRRVSATATEAANKLRAMGQDVPPGIQRIADAAKNITPALSMADKAAGLLKSTFGQFTAAGLATNAIMSLTSGIQQFISTGLKLPAVEQSYSRLTDRMRIDGSTMLANMTTATRGMVANYDLMLSANKAMLLGLPVTGTAMTELAKTATILGRAMGQDATSSLNDLITALGRSSPMILDNLGLTVKVGEANDAYAAKLGKTTEQLTDAEKKMAFYIAAMEAAKKKTAELGEQTKTLGDIATTVWTQFGNLVSATAASLNTSLGRMLSSTGGFIEFLQLTIKHGSGAALSMMDLREKIEALDRARKAKAVDVNLPLEKEEKAVKAVTAAKTAYIATIQKEIALTPEQLQVHALWLKAKEHEKAAVDFAAQSWKAWESTVSTALKNVTKNSAPLLLITRDLSSFAPQIGAPSATGGNMAGSGITAAAGAVGESLTAALSKSLQQLPNMLIAAFTGGGGLQGAVSGMGTLLGGTLGKSIGAGFKSLGKFGGPIGEAIGALAGPLIEKIFGMFGTAGRDVVKDFAASFGGFDALHVELNTLGAEGERLWIALTQGVGRNNPEQAKAAVDAITAAFGRQKTKMEETAATAAAAAAVQQASLDAISEKYKGVIDKLESEFQSLQSSVAKEAEEAVMGIVETQERARMEEIKAEKAAQEAMRDAEIAAKKSTFEEMLAAGVDVDAKLRELFGKPLEIPYRYVAQNEPGTGGATYTPPAGGRGGDGGDSSMTVVIPLDGEVLTKTVVKIAKRRGLT